MRLVCISDTHLQGWPDVPAGDVLIHAGDATVSGTNTEIKTFIQRMGKEPHPHRIFVAGNHDLELQRRASRFHGLFDAAGITYLQDSGVDIQGVRFWGSPWTPEFMDWGFNLPRGAPLRSIWSRIPTDTQVLITHGPPFGIMDQVNFGEHVGCVDLLEAVQRVEPVVHVFGHIHECHGRLTMGATQFINATICDENYRRSHAPVVVDIEPDGQVR